MRKRVGETPSPGRGGQTAKGEGKTQAAFDGYLTIKRKQKKRARR